MPGADGQHDFFTDRAERFVPAGDPLHVLFADEVVCDLLNISRSGLACRAPATTDTELHGASIPSIRLRVGTELLDCGPAELVRVGTDARDGGPTVLGVAFLRDQTELLARVSDRCKPSAYVTQELRADTEPEPAAVDARKHTLDEFRELDDPDVLAKCERFRGWVDDLQRRKIYQRLYRVTITGGLDNQVTIFDPITRRERALVCFDSNSYLGLHRHPRVIEVAREVTRRVGYGTPSAQMLCGTNRYLRELEDALSELHGRESTIVFSTGFAANAGAIQALLGSHDAVIRDRFAHASIHEGCRASPAQLKKTFAHNDPQSLERILQHEAAACRGKLVVTDGVFSMHGRIAVLPELLEVCRRHGARLMVDDAHGVGVLGESGGGVEEHFGLRGVVDVLMGTLSKALGGLGGYVTGSRTVVEYLRFFAATGIFTTALPAPLCAGVTEALRVMREEPEHRAALWNNIRSFVPALQQAGLLVSPGQSPIITVYLGAQPLLWRVSQALFDAGVKCGSVMYPAVGRSDCILRFTLNARHSQRDLSFAVDALTKIGRELGLLGKTREELLELGQRLAA